MNVLGLLLEGAWHVLLAGLILGAGLPALFSVGIRFLAWGAPADADVAHNPPLPAKLAAGLCFLIVLTAVACGISIIVAHGFGMKLVFGWPLFVPK